MSTMSSISSFIIVLSSICVLLNNGIKALPLDAGSSPQPSPVTNAPSNTYDVSKDATDVPTTSATTTPVTTPRPATTPLSKSTPPPEIIPDRAVGNEPSRTITELQEKYVPDTAGHYVRIIPRHHVHAPNLPLPVVPAPAPLLLPSLSHYFLGNPFGPHLPKIYVRVPKGGHYWNPIRSKLFEMDPGVGNYLERMLPAFRNQEKPDSVTDTVVQNQLHTIKEQPDTWLWGDGLPSGKLVMPTN